MIQILYREPGSENTIDITTDVVPGFTITETADTQGNVLNLVVKSKTISEPFPIWSKFEVIINGFNYVYFLTSDQFDNINRSFQEEERYVHNITLAEPIVFYNNVACPSMTFTQPGVDKDGIHLYRRYYYIDVINGAFEKAGMTKPTIDETLTWLYTYPKDFIFENMSLREIIEAVFGAVGEVPKLVLNDITDTDPVLTVMDIEPESTVYNFDQITKESVVQSESYFTNTANTMTQGRIKNNYVYPSNGTFMTPSGTQTILGKKTGNPNFTLPLPIARIEKVVALIRCDIADPETFIMELYERQQTIREYIVKDPKYSHIVDRRVLTTTDTQLDENDGFRDIVFDITRDVIVKEEYDTLDVSDSIFDKGMPNGRDDKVYYSRGDNKIQGLGLNEDAGIFGEGWSAFQEILNNTPLDKTGDLIEIEETDKTLHDADMTVWLDPFDFSVHETNPGGGIEVQATAYDIDELSYYFSGDPNTQITPLSGQTDDLFYWRVRVEYTPIFKAQFKQESPNYPELLIGTSKHNNQDQSYEDLERLGEQQNIVLKLATKGQDSITQRVVGHDTSNIVPLTAPIANQGFVNRRLITINYDSLIIKYDTSPDFKIIPSTVAVNNDPRTLLVDPQQTVDRIVQFNDYIMLANSNDGWSDHNIFAETRVVSAMLETLGGRGTLLEYSNLLPDGAKFTAQMEGPITLSQSFLPTYQEAIGTGIHTFININSAYNLEGKGNNLPNDWWEGIPLIPEGGKIEQKSHVYTNDSGRFDIMDMVIHSAYDYDSSNDFLAIPEYQLDTAGEKVFTVEDHPVYKDSLESLNLVHSLHVIAGSSEIIIYPGFTKHNKYITGKGAGVGLLRTTENLNGLERFVSGVDQTYLMSITNTGLISLNLPSGKSNYVIYHRETFEPMFGFVQIENQTNYRLVKRNRNPFRLEYPWNLS